MRAHLQRILALIVLICWGLVFPASAQQDSVAFRKAQRAVCQAFFSNYDTPTALSKVDSLCASLSQHGFEADEAYYRLIASSSLMQQLKPQLALEQANRATKALEETGYQEDAFGRSVLGQFSKAATMQGYEHVFLAMVDWGIDQEANLQLRADCEFLLGRFFVDSGRARKAIRIIENCISTLKQSPKPDTNAIATCSQLLFRTQKEIGDYAAGISTLNQTLDLLALKYGEDHSRLLLYRTTLATIYAEYGKIDLAFEQIRKSRKSIELGIGHHTSGSYFLLNRALGEVYNTVQQNDSAMVYLEKALAIRVRSRGKDAIENVSMLIQLGTIATVASQFERADRYFEQANEVLLKYQVVAYRYGYESILYSRMAKLEIARGNHQQAIALFQQALNAFLANFDSNDPHQNPTREQAEVRMGRQLITLLSLKADGLLSAYEADKTDPALLTSAWATYTLIESLLSEARSMLLTDEVKLWLNRDYRLCLTGAMKAAALLQSDLGENHFSQQALAMNENQKSAQLFEHLREMDQQLEYGIPKAVTEQEVQFKVELQATRQNLRKAQQQNDSTLLLKLSKREALLSAQLDSLKSDLRKTYPAYYQIQYAKDETVLELLTKALPNPQHAALSYFVSKDCSYVFLVRNGEVYQQELPVSTTLDPLIHQFRKSLIDYQGLMENPSTAKAEFEQAAYALYQTLFPADLEQNMDGVTNLIVIPDGTLSNIPFEALLTDSAGPTIGFAELPYLMQQYAVSYSMSARMLQYEGKHRQEASKGYLGFAPQYNSSQLADAVDLYSGQLFRDQASALWGNQVEVEQTSGLINGKALIGTEATKEAFKRLAPSYRVLHLAMHGVMDTLKPLESRLLFAPSEQDDGFLHGYELFDLQLSADLAVLSSCYSGSGKIVEGEGVMSMARAFSYAGCPSLLTSLWQADDEAASTLMVSFFEQLKTGTPKHVSLHKAKLQYLQQAPDLKCHPLFWANFVLVGDPEAIVLQAEGHFTFWLVLSLLLLLPIGLYWMRKRVRNQQR